ncbi:serine/arginine repetitive matrix protein 1 [Pectinophora gossypiella]|nr:serine/arginine repetitive matrix protein 1 [Pectinophora gossypiella]XP_049885471.1 serine/arginine repetitive matrix protein 1 [Pectinophora gossypiella]
MGCGQSKINLYPRRNKNGSKGSSAKKSGAADKDADEEEGSAGGAVPADEQEEDADTGKHILPLNHPPVVEVSASQQDFFKMLDEKIEEGRDYDSSSETEVQLEQERRRILIDQWRSTSLSTQSSQSQPSPPTPARRRVARPVPQPPERGSPNTVRRYCRQQHVPDGMSPPPRRAHSAQSHHQDPRNYNGDNWHDPTKSPVKRPQSAGANWKNNPKVAPYNQKPKKNEANENQRASQKDLDLTGSSQDVSQITFNPTFQTHSPAHSGKPQPYIAQILSYPMSQQVTPPSPPKYIAPPEEYQDPQNNVTDNKYATTQRQTPTAQVNSQSHIYYIHGNATTAGAQDLAQQRQQTAIHLQQYVAMKQAQQQMISYLQRTPHTVFPNVDYSQTRMYGEVSEEFISQYGHPAMRPHSAPSPVGVVRPMPVGPGYSPLPDGAHMMQMPMWPHMPPVVATMGPWVPGQVPPEMQYYPQSQFMSMYRPNSAGSAGTLTRYHKKEPGDGEAKNNVCQSINLVRQKPIGQIVSAPGQELSVCNNANDSPSPASVSTDSGVSPGNSVPSSKNSVFSAPSTGSSETFTVDNKIKKNKTAPFNTRSLKNSKSLDS